MWGNAPSAEHSRTSKVLIRVVLVGMLAFLLGRTFQLQILHHDTYVARADANRLRTTEIPAPRGLIFDRNGVLLARNRPSYQLAIIPEDLPDDDAATDGVDEEFEAIMDILFTLGVPENPEMTLDMQRNLFAVLGRQDFRKILEAHNIPLTFINVQYDVLRQVQQGDAEVQTETVSSVDIERPLPLEGLAHLIQARVQQRQQGNASEPIPILTNLDRGEISIIAEASYRRPGTHVLEKAIREYVYGELVSHVLGFTGPVPQELEDQYIQSGLTALTEPVGLSGIEAAYQNNLRGEPGTRTIEVDIFGTAHGTVGEVVEPVPGQDIILTLDIELQREMHYALREMLARQEADSGVAIAIDPRNGQVLGLVSLPSFDNNIFSNNLTEAYLRLAEDERRPLINYAIGGLYPPGSTFKIVTAVAGMEERVIQPRTVVVDNGPIYLPNRFFPDDPSQAQEFVSWNHHRDFNHGPLTLRRALAVSNDIYFYYVGGGYRDQFIGLTQPELAQWAKRFGYGEESGIDLPGEVKFSVPDDQWKRINWASSWVTGDSYNMAIGQGYVLATPLQVLQSVVPIANYGTLYKPQMVLQIVETTTGRTQEYTPSVVRFLDVSPQTLDEVRLGMHDAVNSLEGTARNGSIEGVLVAGKTGTAEFCEFDPETQDCMRDEEGHLPTHASYVAFAPFKDPEIAVLVFVYGGGEGSSVAVPVAQRILNAYFALKGLGQVAQSAGG